jgi:hypothetical protein
MAKPMGKTKNPRKGTLDSKTAVSTANKRTSIKLGVGTQSALSTDQTTTIKFSDNNPSDSHPSRGRNDWTADINHSAVS